MRAWGTGPAGLTELIRHSRIKISVAAWSYENNHRPIMSDRDYDKLSLLVHSQINIATGNHRMDRFFQRHFDPSTSLWIHRHPNIPALIDIYARYYQRRRRKRR
jgi:hypothetical protein